MLFFHGYSGCFAIGHMAYKPIAETERGCIVCIFCQVRSRAAVERVIRVTLKTPFMGSLRIQLTLLK
jgi:hypothetical protein